VLPQSTSPDVEDDGNASGPRERSSAISSACRAAGIAVHLCTSQAKGPLRYDERNYPTNIWRVWRCVTAITAYAA